MRLNGFVILLYFLLSVCTLLSQNTAQNLGKFEPENGKCLVFIGQDLAATGGLEEYSDGYSDYFKTPAGITVYTNLSPGNQSFGYTNKGLDGLRTKDSVGSQETTGRNYTLETALIIHLSCLLVYLWWIMKKKWQKVNLTI